MGNDLAHMDEQLDYSVNLLLDHALLRPRSQTELGASTMTDVLRAETDSRSDKSTRVEAVALSLRNEILLG